MYLLTPVILYRLAVRGLKYRGYLNRWRERFGFFPHPEIRNSIWLHAVSVGEVNAALPLIKALMQRYPDHPFVVTTVTPTGSERVRQVFGETVFHVYLPYDLPKSIKRFLTRTQPCLAVIMETEIWPNLFVECHLHGIPVIVANARLSERSLRGYNPVRSLARMAIASANYVAAQSATDAARLIALGAAPARLSIVGNLKFDMTVSEEIIVSGIQYRQQWGQRRPVWIAASTHEAEELPVLKAHAEVLQRFPDALLLIAPRHPERFKAVIQVCRHFGFSTLTRSEDQLANSACQCFVIDSMGELLRFYAASDLAFVGGSLESIGGHNTLEPAALAVPVIVGPHTFNFAEITDSLLNANAAIRITQDDELGATVVRLLSQTEERCRYGNNAKKAFERERGAVEKTMKIVEDLIHRE